MTAEKAATPVYWDDGYRPHRFPPFQPDEDTECYAWKCAACGKWIDEARDKSECPFDWRNPADSSVPT